MKALHNIFLFSFFCSISMINQAQISFMDRTFLLSNEDHHSGVAMSIMDMNGDGLDDIVRQNLGTFLNIELQTLPDQQFIGIGGIETGIGSQWAMCVADVDNDGVNEVVTGGTNADIVVVKVDFDTNEFSKVSLPKAFDVFLQGTNFVDINNDGHLDVFGCHDNGESRIWGNDGFGNFLTQDHWIDMSVGGNSGEPASGNYGSTWLDIDNDGDIDLYIAKCRQNVNDVNDIRRINQLYINDGNGNFTEQASSRGLAIGWQSWTAEFQDINNDGWLDCFITNHDHESQMLLNDGTGYFTELSNTGIELSGIPIQGLMRDFDNDGWVDVVTTGQIGQVFRNNGDLTFTEIPDLFDDNDMESLAVGDLNGDGYLDVYGGYANIYTNPSLINDKLWMNNGGNNNYLTVLLEGKESNRNAIGARVEIYGEWGIQVREVRSGESYGISNSSTSYFGIGQSEIIDSIIVKWPSGHVQTEYDITKNTRVKLIEGECLGRSPQITIQGLLEFCSGESTTLIVEDGFSSYAWNNGSDDTSITVTSSGIYNVEVVDAEGCLGFSENIKVSVDPILYPEIEASSDIEFCRGEEVVLSEKNLSINEDLITWSNGEVGYSTTINSSGSYNLIAQGLCEDFVSNTIDIIVHELPEVPEATGDSIELGEVAILNGVGDQLVWFDAEVAFNPIGFGESIEVEGLTDNATFYVEDRTGSGFEGRVGMNAHQGSPYSQSQNDPNMIVFDAFESFTIDSVKVYTDLAGPREIIISNSFFTKIDSRTVDISEGESVIYLGLEVPAGNNLRLQTGIGQNLQTTGFIGPRLQRSDQNVNFPYIIDDIVSLKGAEFGQSGYYYFYDWKISSGVFCASERTEVDVIVDNPLSTFDYEINPVKVYPNPSNGKFSIEFSDIELVQGKYSIMDLSGKVLLRETVPEDKRLTLDLDIQPGMYFIQFFDGNRIFRNKIVIE